MTPPQDPQGAGQNKCTVAHPIYVSNSHAKFGWISLKGLGGNSIIDRQMDGQMDGWTDGGKYDIAFAFFKKKRGDTKCNNYHMHLNILFF